MEIYISATRRNIIRLISIIITSTFIASCGGNSNNGPEFSLPPVLVVSENSAWEFQIDHSSQEYKTFQITNSQDAQYFEIDTHTGFIRAKHPFDFEAPTDADSNNIYELEINATDINGISSSQQTSVTVTNLDDYSAQIIFPVDQSLTGGGMQKIAVRGHLLFNGVKVTSRPPDLEVYVNGIKSVFTGNETEWSTEIPLASNDDITISAETRREGASEATYNITIDNVFLISNDEPAIRGNDLYRIKNNRFSSEIIKTDLTTRQDSSLIISTDPRFSGLCEHIDKVSIAPTKHQLLIGCLSSLANRKNIFVYNIQTRTMLLAAENIYYYDSHPFKWATNEELLIRSTYDTFSYLHLGTTPSIQSGSVINGDTLDNFLEIADFSVDGDNVYVENGNSGEIFHFTMSDFKMSLNSALNLPNIVAQPLGLTISHANYSVKSNFAVIDGELYRVNNNKLVRINLTGTGGFSTTEVLTNFGDNELWLEQNLAEGSILHYDSESITLQNPYDQHIYELNLQQKTLTLKFGDTSLKTVHGPLRLSDDNKQLSAIDPTSLNLFVIDTDDYTISSSVSFGQHINNIPRFSPAMYSWTDSVIYISPHQSWGGTTADDTDRLITINTKTGTLTSLLDGHDLANALNDQGGQYLYRIGGIALSESRNELWISFAAWNEPSDFSDMGGIAGVFSYNVGLDTLTIIYQQEFAPGAPVDPPLIGGFSESLDGAAIGTWARDSGITLLKYPNIVEEISDKNTPYRVSINPHIDAVNNRIIVSGYFPSTEGDYPDYSNLILSAIDIDSKLTTIIAQEQQTHFGYNISKMTAPIYDSEKDLIYSMTGGLIIIDPQTGHRVMKKIKSKD